MKRAGLLLLLAAFWLAACSSHPSREAEWQPADQRQKVDLSGSLETLDGKRVSLENLPAKVLFVNMWATWCSPCRAEMPSIASLYKELSDEGLGVVAITDEDPAEVRSFLEQFPQPFPILIDRNFTIGERFGVEVLPTTMIIDRKHRLVARHLGGTRWDTPEVIARMRALLAAD